MVTKNTLGIAVWGLGQHAQKNILPAIEQHPTLKLVGICTRNQEKLETASQQLNCLAWEDPTSMLANTEVDIVYLATPTGLHFAQGKTVLQAKKHLLCEKSLTNNAADSLQLIQLAQASDLVLCEAFMFLYHPQFQEVLKIIQAPEFGKIINITSNFGMPTLDNPGFRDCKELGGGAFLDLGCYPLAAVTSLIDDKPHVLQMNQVNCDKTDIDLSGNTTLAFSSGANAYLNWGYNRAYRAEITVWGEKQSLYADKIFSKRPDYTSSIVVRDTYGSATTTTIAPSNSFIDMLNVFCAAISNSQERNKLWNIAIRQAESMQILSERSHGK